MFLKKYLVELFTVVLFSNFFQKGVLMKKKIVVSILLASALYIPSNYAMERNMQTREEIIKRIEEQWNNVLNEDEMTKRLITHNWQHQNLDAKEYIESIYKLIRNNLPDFINKDLSSLMANINGDTKNLLNSIATQILGKRDERNKYIGLQTEPEKLLYILEKGHFPSLSKHGRNDLQTVIGNTIAKKLTNLFKKSEIATADDLFIKKWLHENCTLIRLLSFLNIPNY